VMYAWNRLPNRSVGHAQAHHAEAESGHLPSRLAERLSGQRCGRCHGGLEVREMKDGGSECFTSQQARQGDAIELK
jgi:hypothetical protein